MVDANASSFFSKNHCGGGTCKRNLYPCTAIFCIANSRSSYGTTTGRPRAGISPSSRKVTESGGSTIDAFAAFGASPCGSIAGSGALLAGPAPLGRSAPLRLTASESRAGTVSRHSLRRVSTRSVRYIYVSQATSTSSMKSHTRTQRQTHAETDSLCLAFGCVAVVRSVLTCDVSSAARALSTPRQHRYDSDPG